MPDSQGYPTEETIERIKNWDMEADGNFKMLMEFVCSEWWAADWGWDQEGEDEYHISTGGWSGNEEIIGALKSNWMFWAMCWVQSRRGGHFIFEVKPPKEKK